MQPTLVILAAGLGRRFGGHKQLAALGPGGRPLMAYALHDAALAGFGRAVVVVREGMEGPVRSLLAGSALPVDCAVQPGGRERPWGTGHAVLAAAGRVAEPFMVINADDFYGRDAYRLVGGFLEAPPPPGTPVFALAAFPLAATLSSHGAVNRGACRVDASGWLVGIEEVIGLLPGDGRVPPDTLVSMNCWGFTPAVFPLLEARFQEFRAAAGPEDEFMLPDEVGRMVAQGAARVRVLQAPGPWLGVTHPADREPVAAHLARLVREGTYPPDP